MNQLYWLSGDDPVKIDAYMRMPLWEYWTVLNNKLALWEKQKVKATRRPPA